MTNEMIDENERLEALASIAFARLKAAVEETKIAQSIAQTKALSKRSINTILA